MRVVFLLYIVYASACAVYPARVEASGGPVAVSLDVIAQIESSGRAHAYNKRTGATGMYQIMPICLADYNQYHNSGQYTIKEMFDPAKARNVADWYLHQRIPVLLRSVAVPVTLEHVLYAYNAGAGTVGKWYRGERKLPKETTDYYKKYLNHKNINYPLT